ncbi:ECF transporter S component [Tetragenococcus halophilus]|uniref:ECF transporter S component n=1 Tax=Tetragenococcus halophilus TaxID=51669 RepID=UPI00083D1019|nr:ECF transporter S component [Tetragenococcus halophilus]AOF49187.1 membrane protein [Tetragenococcus halophilus]MCO8287048.1 ECF transporter S component [Tetragenococcus halophilus]GMQ72984.1 ECF transporter S component [Tetragenococcus halophilus]
MQQKQKTFRLVLTAFFLAILLLLATVPFLGFIPIGPINATTLHIPVIIASIVLGPRLGAFLGASFGLISMIRSTIIVTPMSFIFSPFIAPFGESGYGSWKALLITFIPRILIGIVPYYFYRWFEKRMKNRKAGLGLFIAGLLGGIVNTVVVMNMVYFLFQTEYAQIIGEAGNAVYVAILSIIFAQGVPEAIVAGLATAGVATVLLRFLDKRT